MWPERDGVQPPRLAQLVERVQVGVRVVRVVRVGRVVLGVPVGRRVHVLVRPALWLALVVHHVESHHLQGPRI